MTMLRYVAIALALVACPRRPSTGTIPVPGYGKVTREDICGDGPQCDVQGKNPQPLLDPGSSRRTVPDPYAFVGAAFRPQERNSLYGPLESCGELAPTEVAIQTIHGETKATAKNSSDFKATLSANLNKVFKVEAAVDVQRLVETTFDGAITFDRTIYTLKDSGAAARRNAECRNKICAQGRPCKPSEWATIYSAAIVTLSGSSVKTIKEKLVAKISADAALQQAVDAQAAAGAGIDDVVNKALTTSVEQYRFAAFIGWNDTLDSATGIAELSETKPTPPSPGPTTPEPTVECVGDTQWRILKPGRYRFTLTNLANGQMSDASLCTENQKGNPDCWRSFLRDYGKSWETSVPGSDTRLTVWARQGSNASGAMKTGCGSGQGTSIAFRWEDGFNAAFSVEAVR